MDNDYVIEMRGISKSFGAVQALSKVNLELRRGEILGIVGDNAAGKSTLMKILYGVVHSDEGEIIVNGATARIRNPRDAQALGIGMIFQDLFLFGNLDVAANIFVGRELTRGPFGFFLHSGPMYEESAQLLSTMNVDISSPRLLVEKMSGGQRQMVAAARAIGGICDILIMDEATAALGVREANTLLELVSGFRDQGMSIVYITHRIPDILLIGDRVMVLKGGKRVGVLEVGQCTLEDIVTLIVRGRANGAEK